MKNALDTNSALQDIRIIDLTTVVFGPYTTQTLGDYGADIIKVETPDGDGTRYNGPGPEPGMSAIYLGSNRNKRSIVLDLKTPEGREGLLALCDTADVIVHNIRPQKLDKLGLDSATLRRRNPRLIYAGLYGFGSQGPYSGNPAYDDIIQALSGAADLMLRQSGNSGYMPTLIADKIAAQMAVHGILAALFQRERTGRGQTIEVPMFEVVASFMLVEHYYARHWQAGELSSAAPDELGYPRLFAAGRAPYRTTDGHVCVMPYTERNWRQFLNAVGHGSLLDDPRFQSAAARMQHIADLLEIVKVVVGTNTTEYWLELCRKLDIPCAPVNRLEQLESDPHLQAVDFFQSRLFGDEGIFRFPRFPVCLEDSAVPVTLPPRLGEHTSEIIRELELSEDVRCALLSQVEKGASWQ